MKHRDDDIITEIFRTEQNNLYRLACYKIGDTELAADLVQDLFIKVLENPNKDEIKDLKSYLYQSLLYLPTTTSLMTAAITMISCKNTTQ